MKNGRRALIPGTVLCSNCPNPASAYWIKETGERMCCVCLYGEAAALDEQLNDADYIFKDPANREKDEHETEE